MRGSGLLTGIAIELKAETIGAGDKCFIEGNFDIKTGNGVTATGKEVVEVTTKPLGRRCYRHDEVAI